jgi:penicillin-binding protein 1A
MSIEWKKISIQSVARAVAITSAVLALLVGVSGGILLAMTANESNQENFTDFAPSLPTKVLDINGRLITELRSSQMREMISIDELPRYLIGATIVREDKNFYQHNGFWAPSIIRAVLGRMVGISWGGGSTITQQIAGLLKADRDDKSMRRKIVELYWACQFERRYTKNEILQLFLNQIYYGDGYYGVGAASKYLFGKSAKDVTPAEAAILALQPSTVIGKKYNPFVNPDECKKRSRNLLSEMVREGYCSKAEADESFETYWLNFDYTRVSQAAYYDRTDNAHSKYFTNYITGQLDQMLYGSVDYYKDGLVINTTLNLDYQEAATRYMDSGRLAADKAFKAEASVRMSAADSTYIPIVNALTVLFDLSELRSADTRVRAKIDTKYQNQINQVVDASSLLFGLKDLKAISARSNDKTREELKKSTVEGALICVDNETGYILAMYGGSGNGDFNYATQSAIQPGSSIKPLYYSAAIDSRKFTMASLIYDEPIVFRNPDGTPYIPLNFKGQWKGPVLMWYALANSMNIPSLRILDGIGFDSAIDRMADLWNIHDPEKIALTFPRYYPLGLGAVDTNPLQQASAYAIFANGGRRITPIAIRSVEDRNGAIIIDNEKEVRVEQKKKGKANQVISPQTSYIMTKLLEGVTESGTLSGMTNGNTLLTYTKDGKKFTIPIAGKTGTTQNWADAWTVGYSPYMTTAIWFGFDSGDNSLGVNQTGMAIAGSAWAKYMHDVHRDLGPKEFSRPQNGLVDVTVCRTSGQLPTDACTDGTIRLTFLEGTQPFEYCSLHSFSSERAQSGLNAITNAAGLIDSNSITSGSNGGSGLQIDPALLGSPSPSASPGNILD